jgi:2-acylglycerol O-acyltransferase 2
MAAASAPKPKMKPMNPLSYVFAFITLGFLTGWYYFLLFLFLPLLVIFTFRGSFSSGMILGYLIYLTFVPISHKVWPEFLDSWLFKVWRDWFDFSMDIDTISDGKTKKDEKYIFCDMPHGTFPMGPFLSTSLTREIMPGFQMIAIGADAIFSFPVMRQIMSWIGTQTAHRKNITKILEGKNRLVVLPGGIAEMFLVSEETEGVFLKKRHNTVKAAIQEGAHLIPTFFFGNSRILQPLAGVGQDSALAKFSRKIRTSIIFFNPFPYRRPIRMVTGEIIEVQKKENPTDEEVQQVLDKLIAGVKKLYEEKKPDWETRPLVIH